MEWARHDDEYRRAAEFYDYVVPYRERRDVAFFVEIARDSGGPVLEIGCGTGRVLIPTARAGVEIVGLDASPAMLSRCREKLAAEREEVRSRVKLVEADMRDFDVAPAMGAPAPFALVTIPFRPFQHLYTVDDQLACLASIHRHLRPGGKLVLDVFNPSLPLLVGPTAANLLGEEPEFTLPDGRRVRRSLRIVNRDLFNQVNDSEMTYHVTHADGREEQQVHPLRMRYLFRFEVEHLLARSGFGVENLYADYDRSPYGSKYPGELIFVATKRDP
ncbi:MAG TPA: class I SAM-dependent methyltransferase [Terriglobia bacterium]|nr:class I SAM-dependent methyltransferase [Terriglobia bacterium]